MTQRLGMFELLGTLGKGGMGTVYRVRHVQLGGEYALKTIPLDSDEEALLRTRREGEAMALLSGHPHVVSVHSLFEDQGQLCLVLELCPGGDLQARLAQGPLPPAEAARVVVQLAHGLAAVHEAGILHRDLKPANVLFDGGGTPKLTDFGIARVADRQSLTQTGSLLGTPAYMAPEQVEGRRADVRSDVYGLGAILYETLAGAPPFGPGPVLRVLNEVVHAPPPPLPAGVPAPLAALCLRALAKHPSERPQSALAFAAELEGGGQEALGRSLRAVALILGLLILLLVGLLGYRAWSRSQGSTTPTIVKRPTRTPILRPSSTPTPSQSPQSEDPWDLTLPPWPAAPVDQPIDPKEVREVARQLARFPPLAPAAWRARGLRTHAVSVKESKGHLSDMAGPPSEVLARSFQVLEAKPTKLSCFPAAAKGVMTDSLQREAGIRGHPELGVWLLFRATAFGSDAGLRRLGNAIVSLVLPEEKLRATSEEVRRAWGDPAPLPARVQRSWDKLGTFAQSRYNHQPQRALLPLSSKRERRPNAQNVNRALAELAVRSWDLLLLLEAAARDDPVEIGTYSGIGQRIEAELIALARKAVMGDPEGLRSVGMRLNEGSGGALPDRVTGRLMLYLVIEESALRRPHTYYNLGHGSTSSSVFSMGERIYTDSELACLVMSRGYDRTKALLLLLGEKQPNLTLPSPKEAELLFLEAQAEELDAAGLLGREAIAYGEAPGLPSSAPIEAHGGGTSFEICEHLRSWIPHSLVLRMVAREAAQFPAMVANKRRDGAKTLAAADPRRAALFLRGALEGDRLAARQFVDALPDLSVSDPILRLRLLIATAFFGQPRALRGLGDALQSLGPAWQERAERAMAAGGRIYWESAKLSELQKADVDLKSGPSLEASWKILRELDADFAKENVLQRLSEWTAPPFLGGSVKERLVRGLRRLALRHPALAEACKAARGPRSEDPGPEQRLLREVLRGFPEALLELCALWGQDPEQRVLARAALQFALEGIPQEDWGGAAPVAEGLFLPKLAEVLRKLPSAPSAAQWRVFHAERERAFLGAGLPSLADLGAWGLPSLDGR